MKLKSIGHSAFVYNIPNTTKQLNYEDFQTAIYKAMMSIPIQPPIEIPSARFTNSEDYRLVVYIKTAEWMYLLENAVGIEKVDKAFQNYFNLWKFKHPQPADMKAAFEQALNGSLNKFWELLKKEGKFGK